MVGIILVVFGWAWGARTVRSMALSLREREFVNMARFSGASTFDIITREIFPYVYAYMVVGFINTVLFAINTEAALAVIGLSKVEVPTLGSIIFWALSYNALFIGQISWLGGAVAEVVVTNHPVPMRILGVPGVFAPTGSAEWLLQYFGLTAQGICDAALELVGEKE